MDTCDITILNWAEYQAEGRKYETTSWFRMDNDLMSHPLWDILEPLEFKAFFGLWSYVSQRGHKEGKVSLHLATLARLAGVAVDVVESTFRKLAAPSLAMIQIDEMGAPGESQARTESTPSEPGACTEHAPGTPGADTEQAPSVPGATVRNVTLPNETEEEERTEEPARSKPGPLSDLDLGGFLDDIEPLSIEAWIRKHGIEHVRREMPKCSTKWFSSPDRAALGAKALYIYNWLNNAKRDEEKAAKNSAPAAEPACVLEGQHTDGGPLCQLHGRGTGRRCPLREEWAASREKAHREQYVAEEKAPAPMTRAEAIASIKAVGSLVSEDRIKRAMGSAYEAPAPGTPQDLAPD